MADYTQGEIAYVRQALKVPKGKHMRVADLMKMRGAGMHLYHYRRYHGKRKRTPVQMPAFSTAASYEPPTINVYDARPWWRKLLDKLKAKLWGLDDEEW